MMNAKELLKKLNEMDLQMKEPEGNPIELLINQEAGKLGLEFDLSANKEVCMNTNDLLVICENIYEMGYEDGANSEMQEPTNESINEIAMERYLSVEYNEADPSKQTLVLYNGPAVVDSELINLEDPLHTTDQEVRELAKTFWDNITDDIKVAWY